MSIINDLNRSTTKTITFCSGKGGVGKSVITANIGSAFANNGHEVLILDSVLDLPNQQIIFGVEPPIRLSSVLSGNIEPEAAIFNVGNNICLLVDSPVELNDNDDVIVSLNDLVSKLKNLSDFDYLIIDTQSGISDQLLSICLQSDLIVIIITDEPTSLLDAYGLLKILINYVNPQKIKVLVNNVIDSEDASEISEKLNLATNKFLNLELDLIGFVPYSRNVRLSIQRQELLVNNFPDDESSLAINSIANELNSKYFQFSNINTIDDVRVKV